MYLKYIARTVVYMDLLCVSSAGPQFPARIPISCRPSFFSLAPNCTPQKDLTSTRRCRPRIRRDDHCRLSCLTLASCTAVSVCGVFGFVFVGCCYWAQRMHQLFE
jgi:hypothetical protein